MQRIVLAPDNLDARNREFVQAKLETGLFLNSVPKSGSHLLRNIVRMFVPVEQQYQADFIQYATLKNHLAAFDGPPPKLSWGHLFFSDISAITTSSSRKILLVRDPYDWVLAKARFMLSDEFSGELDILKSDAISPADLINIVIFGLPRKNPSLYDTFTHNAVAWLSTGVYLVRFEDLRHAMADLDSAGSEVFFTQLLDACGIAMPGDWRERVRIGADPANSGTARQNLSGNLARLPATLTTQQRALVDYAAPGLRALLGYGRTEEKITA
ncbi:hypothetical protein [Alteraurantiacibacter buctensis]|uniref:Sulfotransferase domain-containing protein n=1 Tax=Alteraurantiacibacter buctensis TaxID=1503981 RepID=A0A844Z4G6_9SPHN|nr:hypothetical protein [Alteraurantiacibacter buctensis]MXO72733.1 hypothetical protein [Alteraurantiacibacter buctensis]